MAVVSLVDKAEMVNSFLEVLSAHLDVPVQLIFQHALDTLNPKKKDASDIVVDTYFERQFVITESEKLYQLRQCHIRPKYCTPSRQAELRAVLKPSKNINPDTN